jgi:hypothetical protein
MALDSLGEIHVWGNQTGYYRLGTSNSITYSNPVNIMSNGSLLGKQVTKIACGVNHGIAIDTSNNVHVWGYGTSGQLGNGLSSVFSYPIMISSFSGKGSEHIGAGAFHSIVASSNGEVYVFGRNQDSELGINSTTPSTCNVPILLKLFPTPTGQSNVFINFTGQHRCFIDGYTPQTIPQLEGLIVSANKNKYITNFTTGQQAITINDSLPLVSLTNKPNDKTVFGVVSLTTANNNKYISEEEYDNLLQQGDIRAEINSVGEGAMWVCDANGPLIAGDYITSSHIPGYGMKQDTHILKNYTVAKITMDCDFTAPLISKQQLKKDLYGNKILDPYGQPIWEDTQESEEAYKTRYLLHTGEVISKSNYEAYRLANSNVYKAAFVGVTYHCG